MEAWELVLAFGSAFVAGYLGSMLWLVLGTLRLPFIVLATGNPLSAAGTNIAISAAAAGAGGLRHAREGRVDWRVVAWIAFPSVAGAVPVRSSPTTSRSRSSTASSQQSSSGAASISH